MPEINLLPWRELKREQENKYFIRCLFLDVIGAIFIVLLIKLSVAHLVTLKTAHNRQLQIEISHLEKKIDAIKGVTQLRQTLLARMQIIFTLQKSRGLSVRLFNELVNIMPDGIFLTKLECVNNLITLLGYAESNQDISLLMRNIEASVWIREPTLSEIKKNNEITANINETLDFFIKNVFRLSFKLKPEAEQSA